MRHFMVILLAGCVAAAIHPAWAHGTHYRHHRTGSAGTTQPSASVTTSTNPATGVTTTTATAGGGQNGNHGYSGRDALYNAEAQSVREQTQERYDDRYFNADRVRDAEIRRASGPDYAGPSATNRPSPIHYGVIPNRGGEAPAVDPRGRTDAFETPSDMDSP